jgi:hypothetical protein
MLSAGAGRAEVDTGEGLNGVLSAIGAWQRERTSVAASQLRDRLRGQIQMYFGSPAVGVVEPPGIRTEELLGKASEILEVFLGASAAEAVKDDALSGLDWTATVGERGE